MNASINARSLAPKAQNLRVDAAYVYCAYVLRYLSVLVLIPYYGRILGPSSYGTVLAAMSLMALVWMIVNYGFSTTGSRELAMSADDAEHGNIFGRQLAARLIMAPVGIAVGVAGTYLSPTLRDNPWFGVLGTLLGLVNAMNLGWFYQGLRRFRLSLIFEAMTYPLNVAFVFMLVKNASDGLYAMIVMLASASIASLCAYLVAHRLLRPGSISLAGGIGEIRSASTIFLQSVNAMLMTSGSTYLLSVLSTPAQVGYFGSVEKLISFALAFLQPAGQVLIPTISHRSKHAPGAVHHLVRKGILFEVGYGLCACLGGFVLAPLVIPLAFGAQFHPSIGLFRIMVWALPFAAFTHAIGCFVLIPQKNERWLVVAVMTGNVVNLALIAVLTPRLGSVGVSIARVSGECLIALTLGFLLMRMNLMHRHRPA